MQMTMGMEHHEMPQTAQEDCSETHCLNHVAEDEEVLMVSSTVELPVANTAKPPVQIQTPTSFFVSPRLYLPPPVSFSPTKTIVLRI